MRLASFRYSRWDGTQTPIELDADSILSEITDDLLYHGDLQAALRRLLQSGMAGEMGERLKGVREMIEQLRRKRREELEEHNLSGVLGEIRERLDEIETKENREIDRRLTDPEASADQRQRAENAGMEMAMLPNDLGEELKSLQEHDWHSEDAKAEFDALMQELRQQLLDRYLSQMSSAMGEMGPQDMQRLKDMMSELNQMLADRAAGKEPDFNGFMSRYGDFFPENPRNLDELLEVLAQRMAQMQALMQSMSPDQRRQLQSMVDALLEDMDLRWQVDQLSQQLREMFPGAGWNQRYNFQGDNPLGLADAMQVMNRLSDIDQLENLLRGANTPAALAEVDVDKARELLGDDSARSLERLAELARLLQEAGFIDTREGRMELTPKGMRKIGQNALGDLFKQLQKDRMGRHEVRSTGGGGERSFQFKPYEFGDPFQLDVEKTIRNALVRAGPGTPVRLTPDDFEIERNEIFTTTSTVLMLDLSLSMPMRDNFLAAKKVAMALHSLITTQFPRDDFSIVGFSEVAREIRPQDLPEASWDFVYGTNMQHAFALSRRILARGRGRNKQIIMVTDGEPTAHIDENGDPYFQYPPVRKTIEETLKEVARCTREKIRINTFMLDESYHLRAFVEQMTRLNRGRAFFTTPESLGDYVLVDFMDSKKKARQSDW